jgi:hypothetical protein
LPDRDAGRPTEELPLATDDELAKVEEAKAKKREWEQAEKADDGPGPRRVSHAKTLRAMGVKPLEDLIGPEANEALKHDANRGSP